MAGSDLLDSIGAPHADKGIHVGHTVENRWKKAWVCGDLIDNFRNPAYGASITARELLEENLHVSVLDVLIAAPMATAIVGITRYRSAMSPK